MTWISIGELNSIKTNIFVCLRKVLALTIVLSALLTGLATQPRPILASSASLSVLSPGQVNSGQTFKVDLIASSGYSIAGLQCDLNFDGSILTPIDIQEGSLFKNGGTSTYFNKGSVQNGSISGISCAVITPGSTFTGEGIFATITFEVGDFAGTSLLSLSGVIFGDQNGVLIPTTTIDSQVIVTSKTNHQPVLNPVGNHQATVGQLVSFSVSGSDSDGDILSYSASNLPVGSNFNSSTKVFSWVPSSNQIGIFTGAMFQVSDGKLVSSETVDFVVNDPNVIKTTPNILLVSSLNPSVFGQSVTITITINATSVPLGTVVVKDGAVVIGTLNVTSSQSTLAIGTLAQGSHSLIASYSGDSRLNPANSDILIQTVNTTTTQSGVGGGGGGFGNQLVGIGLSGISPFMDGNGKSITTGQISSSDGEVTLTVPVGVYIWNAAGAAQSFLSANSIGTPPQAPSQETLVQAYEMGPSGVTFTPAITLIMSYNNETLPIGSNNADLYIAWWDGIQWIKLESSVNIVDKTVSAQISHFTSFALLAPQKSIPSSNDDTSNDPNAENDSATPTLSPNSVQLKITPIYNSDLKLSTVTVGYQYMNVSPTAYRAEVALTVTLDGNRFDERLYLVDLESTEGVLEYKPPSDWQNGIYNFVAEMRCGEFSYSTAFKIVASNNTESEPVATSTVRWQILGELIGCAVVISALISFLLLIRYRRLNVGIRK